MLASPVSSGRGPDRARSPCKPGVRWGVATRLDKETGCAASSDTSAPGVQDAPAARPRTPRVPRLRLRRASRCWRRRPDLHQGRRQPPEPARARRRRTARPPPPASATRAGRHTAASPRRTRTRSPPRSPEARDRAQRDRGELQGASRPPGRRGPRLLVGDRRGDRHAPDRGQLRGRSGRGRPPRLRRARGALRLRRDPPRPSRPPRRRAAPVPDGRRDRAGETFLASNAAAFLRETRQVQFPDDGEIVVVEPEGARYLRAADGSAVDHELVELDWDDEGAEKNGYETFMLKEIHEQPDAVANTIGDRLRKAASSSTNSGERRGAPRAEPHRHPLRGHELPRRRCGPLRARGMGARPGRARHRVGVDLP